MDQSILKKYDIRGTYPDQINADIAYSIGRAFAKFLKGSSDKKLKIIVGHDMRVSSPELHKAVLRGVTEEGVDVDDAGLIATDQMYYLLGAHPYDGGMMITASHNPKNYNGLKMYRAGVEMVSAEEIQEIGKMAENLQANNETLRPASVLRQAQELRTGEQAQGDRDVVGVIKPINDDAGYTKKILSFVDKDAIKPLHVVLDAGNGMAGRTFPLVLAEVPQIKHEDLYFKPDGTFPNHEPNPEKLENTKDIQERVAKEGADFGAAFDGDADRILLIDHEGNMLRGDIIAGIFARHFLQTTGPGPIVYNVLCTKAVEDVIKEYGGTPVRWKTGHTFMKAKMREVGAVFGGEMSGHLFFKEFYFAESSTLAFLLMCQIISQTGKTLAQLAEEFRSYGFWSRYIYLNEGDTPAKAIERVRERYESGAEKTEKIDGETFYFDDPWWWFNIRPSNTEPRISLTIEAHSDELVEEKKQEIFGITGGRIAGEG